MKINGMDIGGEIKEINLNGRKVSVITPKKKVSHEEGLREIRELVDEIRKRAGLN